MFDIFPNKFLHAAGAALVTLAAAVAAAAAPAPGATEWVAASGPAAVRSGETFTLRVRVRNSGATPWEARGGHRSVLAAMVVDGNGSPWPAPETRASLTYPVPARAATTVALPITAPSRPGRYRALIGRGTVEKGTLRMDPAPFAWSFEVPAP